MTFCAVSAMITQHFYKYSSLSQILTAIDDNLLLVLLNQLINFPED